MRDKDDRLIWEAVHNKDTVKGICRKKMWILSVEVQGQFNEEIITDNEGNELLPDETDAFKEGEQNLNAFKMGNPSVMDFGSDDPEDGPEEGQLVEVTPLHHVKSYMSDVGVKMFRIEWKGAGRDSYTEADCTQEWVDEWINTDKVDISKQQIKEI
jgi:hypothetical protein